MKKLAILTASLLGLCAPALAQGVNTVPQVGMISSILRQPTYTATSVALVPPASAGTDVFCINANASKNISIRRIALAGAAGTATDWPILIYRRATLDTGGTAGTALQAPVAVPVNPADPASTTVLTSYTANPTITDASPALLGAITLYFPVVSAIASSNVATWTSGTSVDMFQKGLDLTKGSTQQICLNMNSASITSPIMHITMDWQETP